MIDIFGRQITLATVAGFDRYTSSDGIVVALPQGASQTKVLGIFASMAPASYAAPAIPTSQTYTPQAFGILAITEFILQPGLTPNQKKTLAANAGPYVSLAILGDIAGLLALTASIPVDGTLITAGSAARLQLVLNNYLNGL